MKSFVRDRDDGILDRKEKILIAAIVGPAVIALEIGKQMYGEAAYLVFYAMLAVLFVVQKARQHRDERAKERSGGARSTGSR